MFSFKAHCAYATLSKQVGKTPKQTTEHLASGSDWDKDRLCACSYLCRRGRRRRKVGRKEDGADSANPHCSLLLLPGSPQSCAHLRSTISRLKGECLKLWSILFCKLRRIPHGTEKQAANLRTKDSSSITLAHSSNTSVRNPTMISIQQCYY